MSNIASNLERNGARLHYEVTGVGQPVLLTHGFAATSRIWRDQALALAPRNELIVWDMRGHGRTRIMPTSSQDVSNPPPGGNRAAVDEALFSVDETLDDMAAILDHLGHERAVIGGHSLGGYMALAFYEKYPARVRALLILSTGPGYKKDSARDEWNVMARGLGRRIEKHGLESLRELDRNMDPTEHESALELGLAARGMLVQKDCRIMDSLSEIQVPTLIVVGEKDRGYVASSNYMNGKIQDAELITIPDAGHAVNLHQPKRFNAAVAHFLNRLA